MTRPSASRQTVVAVAGLLWSLVGVAMWVMQVTMSPDTLAAMPGAQRAVYAATPAWINGVFGLAVSSGLLGCIGLLMRRGWAAPVLLVLQMAVLVQMAGAYLTTPAWDASGAGGLVLPALLILIAFGLWRFAVRAGSGAPRAAGAALT